MTEPVGRWPAVGAAVAAGLLAAALGAAVGGQRMVALSALLAGCMAAITLVDARSFKVPDAWNGLAALAGLAAAWLQAGPGLEAALMATASAALQGVMCAGAFLLLREAYFRLRGVEGLGFGDVKLAGTGGIWLAWQLFAVAVVVAAVLALIWVAARAVADRSWPRHRRIALGAFLAPAIWVCWYGAAALPLRLTPMSF